MTYPEHIDEPLLRRLFAGEIEAEEARRLRSHLLEPCDACEAFLAARGRVDALDGALDVALNALVPRSGDTGSDIEWARIQRRLRARRRRWYAGLAVAAGALLAVGVALQVGIREPGVEGEKGSERPPVSARLRFSVAIPGPGLPAIERGASGAVVPADASLLFRVEVSGPGQLALLHLGAEGAEVIWQGSAPGAGALDVEVGGRPAAYPLRGMAGRQRFALLAAPALDGETLATAQRMLSGPAASAGPGPAISLDLVEVMVQ